METTFKKLKGGIMKNKYYIYCWWSGIRIEQEHCKINKIDDKKVYFWNDDAQLYQEDDIKNLRIDDNYYICEEVQY